MGIPVGKLALYTACAGIDPESCLPVTLDVGTNNEELRKDLLYLGYPRKRLTGNAYFTLVDEFVSAAQSRYPDALIQFEDFLTPNAYALLNRYRERALCFNDDIQGTAAVALAGVYSSTRITSLRFTDLNIMFLGAGSAATGIADLMTAAFVDEGLTVEEARRHLSFVDVNGLVVKSRTDLLEHNLPYAHDMKPLGFIDAIEAIRPHVLIGATGAPGTFTQAVVERMSSREERFLRQPAAGTPTPCAPVDHRKFSINIKSLESVWCWTRMVLPSGDTARRLACIAPRVANGTQHAISPRLVD